MACALCVLAEMAHGQHHMDAAKSTACTIWWGDYCGLHHRNPLELNLGQSRSLAQMQGVEVLEVRLGSRYLGC